jgi:hypothetical protein
MSQYYVHSMLSTNNIAFSILLFVFYSYFVSEYSKEYLLTIFNRSDNIFTYCL